jgi:thiosulfate dehydrogenase [quinone] large subunit
MEQTTGRAGWGASPLTWLAAIQLVAAYEWLVSGLNKVLAGNFPQQLHGVIMDAMKGNPNVWDLGFLKGVVLPCCTIFGGMVECGEVLVGAALAVAALLWVLGERVPALARRVGAWTAGVACLGAAFMNVNFYIAMGGTFPAVSAANAANEGVSIDVLLMLVMLALAAANLALAPRRAARSALAPAAAA